MTTIYVEGGGSGRNLRAKCREAFRAYFAKTALGDRLPKVVAAAGRGDAFNRFRSALSQTKVDELIVLLVDSEGPVAAGSGPWTHLSNHDNWRKPEWASDENAHLMVQCMEAWFLADKNAVAGYFGPDFAANALPSNRNIEQVPKTDIDTALKNATRATSSRRYDKGRDSFAILGELDPELVAKASPHAARLLHTLEAHASE